LHVRLLRAVIKINQSINQSTENHHSTPGAIWASDQSWKVKVMGLRYLKPQMLNTTITGVLLWLVWARL